jgi:CRISPR-associated endonuclease Csn1
MTRKILGLDLGSTSIGFALIEEVDDKKKIVTMGSRIIPLNIDDKNQFSQGQAISKNKDRTTQRTARKGLDRYQQRRLKLGKELKKLNMYPDLDLWKLPSLELFGLRDKALKEPISLQELGRILMHFNQKRGYKSMSKEENEDKKATEYVAEVKGRYKTIQDLGLTIGQYFYQGILADIRYRVKNQVFPREAYIEEFETIWKKQASFFPEVLTEQVKQVIQKETIYYQRPLKSQKGLVSVCEFEGKLKTITSADGKTKELFIGPKVAPKSSPLFQIEKIWETINTLTLKSKRGEDLKISLEQKQAIFTHLNTNDKLSLADLFKILKISRDDYYGNKQIGKGIQGNPTKTVLSKILGEQHSLLAFDLEIHTEENTEGHLFDRKTGEVLETKARKYISPAFEQQPLYQLWHTAYSIKDENECKNALISKFDLTEEHANAIAKIDFTKSAFGNKSAKAMRKILPYLIDGYVYSDACSFAGYNHSNSKTTDERLSQTLKDKLDLLPKNSLRQPIVEKVLNQLINLVNAVTDKYGKPDEIRIELARELKQSKEERNDAFKYNTQREKENEGIVKRLEEYGLRPTRNNIIKWRLFHEISNEESKLNATCVYCGKSFGISDALRGNEVDVEHIIPKSLLFDDSQSNKTLSHRSCNQAKDKSTAYDYMKGKGEDAFDVYVERVNILFKNRIIGKGKRDKLLMPQKDIPTDFIERQLRETQYIAKKSKELLEEFCPNVWSTSGSVTEKLRKLWGWEDVLMNLQYEKYKAVGQTETKEWENKGQVHQKEVIKDWTKRDDHRHHAIDALTVACTNQGFIQRINTLSSEHTRNEMYANVQAANETNAGRVQNPSSVYGEKRTLLENYLLTKKPFSTSEVEEVASQIFVSFKAGKKVATLGVRKIKKNGKKVVVQTGIIEPRGPLSEESVYGKIKVMKPACPMKLLFENPQAIVKERIRNLVQERIAIHEGDSKKALSSLKKEPIYLNETKTQVLEYGTIFVEEYVIKYPLSTIDSKKAEKIVDKHLKEVIQQRLKEFNGDVKKAYATPLYHDKAQTIPISTVRCFTGLSAVEPIQVKDETNGVEYNKYVKPGNNHHVAIYKDKDGNLQEHIATFWHAVERKKYGIPVVIENPSQVWDSLQTRKEELPQSFLEKLPEDSWALHLTMQQNEMFVLGMNEDEWNDAVGKKDKPTLSKHLFRIQKLSKSEYAFRHHLETELVDSKEAVESKRFYSIRSLGALTKLNPKKVRVNVLGEFEVL